MMRKVGDKMNLYKVLNRDGSCYHGGVGSWPLPIQNSDGTWAPGEWMPALKGELKLYVWGYHVLEPKMLIDWIGPAIFEVEVADCERIKYDSAWVVRGPCRLLRRVPISNREWRLFAHDCAERVAHLRGNNPRSRQAIDAARHYANSEATNEELIAAWDAAWDAADAAAWAVVRDAADTAAWNAEREWQASRLIEYLEGRRQERSWLYLLPS